MTVNQQTVVSELETPKQEVCLALSFDIRDKKMNGLQREEYSHPDEPEWLAMLSLRGLSAYVYFILYLSYSKVKQRFCIFTYKKEQVLLSN